MDFGVFYAIALPSTMCGTGLIIWLIKTRPNGLFRTTMVGVITIAHATAIGWAGVAAAEWSAAIAVAVTVAIGDLYLAVAGSRNWVQHPPSH